MVKINTIDINTVKAKYDLRLSPNYYYLNFWFDLLEKSGKEVYCLSKINNYVNSGSYIPGYIDDGGIRYIRVGDIKKYYIDESELKYVLPNKVKKKDLLNSLDIYFGRTQATYSKLGIFSMCTERISGSAVSQHVAKISINKTFIDPYYVLSFLNSNFGRTQTLLASYGDTRVEFTNNQIEQLKILKLENEIYEKIISLTKRVILLNESAIAKYNEAQFIINDKFDIKIDECDKEDLVSKNMLLESDLWTPSNYKKEYVQITNHIIKNFKYLTIDECAKSFKKGVEVGSKNYRLESETSDSSLPFIRTSDIFNGEIDRYPDYFFDSQDDSKLKLPTIKKDMIIYSKDGKIGQCSIVDDCEFIPSSGFIIIDTNSKVIDPNYLFAILSNKKIVLYQALMKTVIAATIPHLKIERFKKCVVPLFDANTTSKIVDLIKEFREINIEKRRLEKEIKYILNNEFSNLKGN